MTDAYQCDKCKEFNLGSGNFVIVGKAEEEIGHMSEYMWLEEKELCDECYSELKDIMGSFFGEERYFEEIKFEE